MKNVFEDMFIRFDMEYERDSQTDRQTPHDGIGRAYAQHRAALPQEMSGANGSVLVFVPKEEMQA